MRQFILFSGFIAIFSIACFADTIYLKKGEKLEVTITKTTDDYVKGDYQGMPVVYFTSEIDHIESGNADNADRDKEKFANEVLALSGFETQIKLFKKHLFTSLMRYDKRLKPEMSADIQAVIDRNYAEATAYALAKDKLKNNLTYNDLSSACEYFKLPTVASAVKTIDFLLTDAGAQELAAFSRGLALSERRQVEIDILNDFSPYINFISDFVRIGIEGISGDQHISQYNLGVDLKGQNNAFLLFIYKNCGESTLTEHRKLIKDGSIAAFSGQLHEAVLDFDALAARRAAAQIDIYLSKHEPQLPAVSDEHKVSVVEKKASEALPHTNLVPASWVDKK